ncbi:hypothetical protein O181_104718 [Austropuccinia psidii MF-1]|uniref:Uncharacterized protein n=1 Tax=Austropuccinia psidii MF-1 TaxID=1389203 RepID=A0A9Q3JMS4_9BASI|nr:hypothetical protein [Austropuccinia psidii MF-1]
MSITEDIPNLENQLGKIDCGIITMLAIYSSVPPMHQLITPAINTLMETNPEINICPVDLLNMIRKISTTSISFDHRNVSQPWKFTLLDLNMAYPFHIQFMEIWPS